MKLVEHLAWSRRINKVVLIFIKNRRTGSGCFMEWLTMAKLEPNENNVYTIEVFL